MSSNQVINPKPCSYNCGTRIYWDTVSNSYLELISKQKHVCKNRSVSTNTQNNTYNNSQYYSKKGYQKMSNSIELISGSISEVQKKYEILYDIVTEYREKFMVHNLI